ncbi:MAG: mitochondrial fission ELM1 family protein, partial [Beijerinckiaceae bacterium]
MTHSKTFSALESQLDEARHRLGGARCWILTDGKAGDEAQCLGVAERLGLSVDLRHVNPRAPFAWAMPLGPIDPREAPDRAGSPLAPPYPDIAIASGRRAVAYLRRLKREAGPATLTVFLKDPRTGAGAADLIWVPAHDSLRGSNVQVTLTSPHRISPERLAVARASPAPWGMGDGRPGLGVLLGGDSRHHRFSPADIARFIGQLGDLVATGLRPLVTPSRRTPPALAGATKALVVDSRGYFWDGTGENPYLALLAHADLLVVTADSVNMLG